MNKQGSKKRSDEGSEEGVDEHKRDDANDLLSEFRLIERLRAAGHARRDDVVVGIGDDAALTRWPVSGEAQELVTATDMLVEGTHFLADTPPESIGHRSLAVNLSDLAAMGATPMWASMALCLPNPDDEWLDKFAAGFSALADRIGVQLIGGDTVRGPLSVSVTVQGRVPAGQAVLRSGAREGDVIFVTGVPGAAATGRFLLGQSVGDHADAARKLIEKFLYPHPLTELGVMLRPLANAMIDISDGLHSDLQHLLNASNTGAKLNIEALELPRATEMWFDPARALEVALCGGDDYELLFTVAADNVERALAAAKKQGCQLTELGVITASSGAQWWLQDEPYSVPDSGYRHFVD